MEDKIQRLKKSQLGKVGALLAFVGMIISASICLSEAQEERSHFGVQGTVEKFAREMKEAGIEITREWIVWKEIEPENNNYNWIRMDSKVKAANEAGIEILGYFISIPDWARDKSDPRCSSSNKKMGDICTPKNWQDYEEFARKVAQRYDGKHGYGEMKYIGIFNEVQLFSRMTAIEYAPWLVKGYSSIKQGNPNVQVLIGSFLDPFEFSYAGEFIDAMFRDYANYFDIVDFHVYRKEVGVTGTSRYMRERMEYFGLDKPLWITETATNLPKIPCDNLGWYDLIAKDVIKRYSRAFSEGVDAIFWFGFVGPPTNEENKNGMLKCGEPAHFNMGSLGWSIKASNRYHPRPAYYAYKTMVSKLSGFNSVEKIADTQYKFTFPNKNPVYLLWDNHKFLPLPREIIGSVKVTDYRGNEERKHSSEVVLTEDPIFLE
jgi:hypothetical protein